MSAAKRAGIRSARGAVAVEMAILLPFLLVLVLVTSEFGRMLYQYSALTQATRDGARFAATNAILGSTGVIVIDNQLRNSVRNLVVYGNVSGAGQAVLEGLNTNDVVVSSPDTEHVLVNASYAYQPMFATIPFSTAINPNLTFQVSLRMRAL